MDRPSIDTDLHSNAIYSAITTLMEASLNSILFKEPVLKAARIRLAGKVMSIEFKELDRKLTLVFTENDVSVLSQSDETADCTIKTSIFTLMKLKDKQQLSHLINQDKVVIEGDMQIVQHWSGLLDMAEWDPAHYLSPYIGDIAAEGISQFLRKASSIAFQLLTRQKNYMKETLLEEWRIAPNPLEFAYLTDEIEQISRSYSQLEMRLQQLEEKNDTR